MHSYFALKTVFWLDIFFHMWATWTYKGTGALKRIIWDNLNASLLMHTHTPLHTQAHLQHSPWRLIRQWCSRMSTESALTSPCGQALCMTSIPSQKKKKNTKSSFVKLVSFFAALNWNFLEMLSHSRIWRIFYSKVNSFSMMDCLKHSKHLAFTLHFLCVDESKDK